MEFHFNKYPKIPYLTLFIQRLSRCCPLEKNRQNYKHFVEDSYPNNKFVPSAIFMKAGDSINNASICLIKNII